MLDELAIVIPAKNEEDMIGNLLSSLCIQNYSRMRETPIFIADADSTDAIIQVGSKFSRPFCPGAFMLFDRERFTQLGGFNEKVLYAEDYFLTRNVESKRF